MLWVLLTLCGVVLLLVTRPWQKRARTVQLSRGAAVLFCGFSLLDWGLLNALAPLGISYGSAGLGLMCAGLVRLFLAAALVFSQRVPRAAPPETRTVRLGRRQWPRRLVLGLAALAGLNLGVALLLVDSFYIEPQALGVTTLTVSAPGLPGGRSLRVVHLTDLHVERLTPRERELPGRVAALQPDVIVLTGDYLNQEYVNDPAAQQAARAVLAQLHAPLGVYAVTGTVDRPEDMDAMFSGLDIVVVHNEIRRLDVPGAEVYVVGVEGAYGAHFSAAEALPALMREVPPAAYTLLLYHMPDLIETAAGLGVDLYLAGHTHGGQIRLPFYGALITFSAYGKQYEMGRYTVGPTTLYVSRGIGLEGLGLPRARFLCPPELELMVLEPGP